MVASNSIDFTIKLKKIQGGQKIAKKRNLKIPIRMAESNSEKWKDSTKSKQSALGSHAFTREINDDIPPRDTKMLHTR
jgi:hypothetical protein